MPEMHFHPEFEIYYLFEGSRYYFIEDKTYQVNAGSLVLLDAMQIHRTSACGGESHDRFLIEFASESFAEFFFEASGITLKDFFSEHTGIFELNEDGRKYIEDIFHAITREFTDKLPHYQSLIMLKIAELLLFVMRWKVNSRAFSNSSELDTAKHKKIDEISRYIMENYHNALSLSDVSRHFFISKSYLCRIFKEVTGFSVQDYINILRVKKAQELLENTEMSVLEIAASLGYGSVTFFDRVFRKYTETTPLKYRKQIRMIHSKARRRENY